MSKFVNNTLTPFTMVNNNLVKDSTLSAKAKGIFLYLASRPTGWQFYETEITSHFTDGLASIRSGIKELIEAGILLRFRKHDAAGRAKYDYELIDPYSKTNMRNSNVGKSKVGKSKVGKSHTINKDLQQKRSLSKKDLEGRKADFLKKMQPHYEEGILDKVEAIKFFEYWTEHGESDTKMRFEKEKSYNVGLRMKRWARNASKFNGSGSQAKPKRGVTLTAEDFLNLNDDAK